MPVERPEVDWLRALEINHPYEIAASDAESVPASGRNMTTVPNLLHHRDLVKVKEAVYLFWRTRLLANWCWMQAITQHLDTSPVARHLAALSVDEWDDVLFLKDF